MSVTLSRLAAVIESRKIENGGDIAVLSSKQLTGQVYYKRFTSTLPQTVECEGVYDATFTRPDSVVAPT